MRIAFLFIALQGALALGAIPASVFTPEMRAEIKAVVASDINVDAKLEALTSISWKKKQEHDFELAQVAVALTPRGRQLLKELTPLLKEARVKLLPLRHSAGTAGYYEEGKLHIDNGVPLIALAATLFHEATHAVDWNATEEGQKRWTRFQEAKEISESGPLLLASEFLAYGAQNEFLTELSKVHESLEEAIEYAATFRYILAQPLTLEQFQALMTAPEARGGYGLPTPMVKRFLQDKKW